MNSEALEWLHQAEFEYEDATYLISGERYSITVFCCHLAFEKGLKALYLQHLILNIHGPTKWIFLSWQF